MPSDGAFRKVADCASCEVIASARLSLPETEVEAYSAKLQDGDRALAVTVLGDGSPADEAELLAKEQDTARARYGRLTPELFGRLRDAAPDERVKVWIWTRVELEYPEKEAFSADPEAGQKHDDEVRATLEKASAPILEWLRAHDAEVTEDGRTSPELRAELRADDVVALSELETVSAVGDDSHPGEPASTAWLPTVRGDLAHWLSDGDVAACVVEGAQPDNYTWLPVAGIATPTGGSAPHMRLTLGLIRNTFGPTMTTSSRMFVGNWGGYVATTAAPSVEQWCMNRRSVAINFSWSFSSGAPGGQNGSDISKDFLTKRFPYPLFVKAAGNSGASAGFDTVHNRSFNSLIVGASEDHGTTALTDDTIASFSSWRNFTTPHNDFELPSVVAPGVAVDSADGLNVSGTSFATPITTGAVMLAARRDMGTFEFWPEMLRAVAIATAVHDVDGGAFVRLPSADSRDGAGQVHALFATALGDPKNFRPPGSNGAAQGRYRTTMNFANEFGDSMTGKSFYRLYAESTGRMRVAIAFDSTATCNQSGCNQNVLDADLDLVVTNTAGQVVCTSASWDSSWEACDFPVKAGQGFIARVRKWSNKMPSTYFSIAWLNWVPGNE